MTDFRFKVWHYSGSMLFERPWNKEEELLEVMWQTFNTGTFKEKPVVYKKVEGITPSQPEGKIYHSIKSKYSGFILYFLVQCKQD